MSGPWADQLALLPAYLARHLELALSALAVGIALSVPLALLAVRRPLLRGPLLAVASSIQTIPSLALLALMVPLLRTIGFLPAFVALVLYSMLPILRNTVTGIESVDPDLVEAGRGLGMTDGQLLRHVQLPLAMPVIVAGIRTATVWVIGIATLSTPVGATSLGNYIFSGLQTRTPQAVVVGCAAAAALALVLDGLVRLLETAAARRSRRRAVAALAGLALVVGGGLAPLAASALRGPDDRPVAVVGAKTFTEQYVLAAAIEARLEDAGFRVRRLDSLGSSVVFDALAAGEIDVYVDYSGTIWTNVLGRTERAPADEVLRTVTERLAADHAITCLGALGFENTYALAMREADAQRLGVATVADLARPAPRLSIGGDYEFFGRPEWESLRETYGLDFGGRRSMDASLMYEAVRTGDLDVISAFSTDGRIAAFDLRVLDDPRGALPPYDAILLVGPRLAEDDAARAALAPLLGAIDGERMRAANMAVDVEGADASATGRALAASLVE